MNTTWTIEKIRELIADHEQETLQLEFKGKNALAKSAQAKQEISKDVSAFANSIGGTIIYGISEAREAPSYAESIDGVDSAEFSTEWLDQVITSNIQPQISGVIINSVRIDKNSVERVVHCVTVPESSTVHQANDYRYYKRTNCRTVPMEDYEVRLAMFRSARPAYTIVPESKGVQGNAGVEHQLSAVVINCSEVPGHECSLFAYTKMSPRRSQTPEYIWTEFNGIRYCRLVGPRGIDLMPGPERLEINPPIEPRSTDPIEIMFRLYDRFGLALAETYEFNPNRYPQFKMVRSVETGRRSTADVP